MTHHQGGAFLLYHCLYIYEVTLNHYDLDCSDILHMLLKIKDTQLIAIQNKCPMGHLIREA